MRRSLLIAVFTLAPLGVVLGSAIASQGWQPETLRGITETVNTVDSLLQQVTGSGNGDNPVPQPQTASPSPPSDPSFAPVASPPVPSTTAQTSDNLQIIHHDNRPTRCHTQGNNPLQCEAFRVTMMPSEGALVPLSFKNALRW